MQGLIHQTSTATTPAAGRLLVVTATGQIPPLAQQLTEQLNLDIESALLAQQLPPLDPARPYVAALVIIEEPHQPPPQLLAAWVAQARKQALNVLIVDRCQICPPGFPLDGATLAHPDESLDMLHGRLATLLDLRKTLNSLNNEIQRLKLLNEPLGSHFAQVDEEMRLAARLQQDFLPRSLPEVPGIHFATVYRPASWVSGDIYDVMRLDEEHIGFYIADAVGHGMPAALLTIFIKRALQTKRIANDKYQIISPEESLALLNQDLVEQNLAHCQFATACYCTLNVKTLQLDVARAGHPYPLLIRSDRSIVQLGQAGALLGVLPGEAYDSASYRLAPGDKLLLYSDGLEDALFEPVVNHGERSYAPDFLDILDLDIKDMLPNLSQQIAGLTPPGSLRDDITVVALEIAPE